MIHAAKTIAYIANWLETYRDSAQLAGFVVGVSGGIDSAVASALCAHTGQPVTAVSLPIFQHKDQVNRAAQHLSWLDKHFKNVTTLTLELTATFQAIGATFPKEIQDDLTMANTRSRLRMMTLYAIASHRRLLVVGTGNKVEDFGVGFFTKYGDGGVDLSPLADLMKSEVYTLAKALGVHQGIIDAPPTDGLWSDHRTDETQIGASYGELEWAMQFDKDPIEESSLPARKKEVLAIYRRLNRINRHKTDPIPVCKIPAAFRTF